MMALMVSVRALSPFGRRHGRWRRLQWALILAAMMAVLWWSNRPAMIDAAMLFSSDGDSFTLRRGDTPLAVRLRGIDAPEARQLCDDARGRPWQCGIAARKALETLAPRGAAIRCRTEGRDRFGRTLSRCTLPDRRDLGALMVEGGWAIATDEDYLVEEDRARSARRGIWQGDFLTPAEWRAAHPRR
jgi:endonuclease YncB( thermonuclease family)